MKYRKLGKTGLEISEISIGTDWLEKKSPECGDCIERCPFDVHVIEKMKEAATLFE